MHLHKIVNGRRFDLEPQEEAEILSEWAANESRTAQRRQEIEQRRAKRQVAQNKLAATAGLTEEEKQILFGE